MTRPLRIEALYLCREMTGETSVVWAGGSISAELESRLGMTRSRKNLRRIASLRGGSIESEGKYLIFEMRHQVLIQPNKNERFVVLLPWTFFGAKLAPEKHLELLKSFQRKFKEYIHESAL